MKYDADEFRTIAKNFLALIPGVSESIEEAQAYTIMGRALLESVDEVERLSKQNQEQQVILERIRVHAQKMAEWKGAPSPFGALHGVGMVDCANHEGENILNIFAGEIIRYHEPPAPQSHTVIIEEVSCKSVLSDGKNETGK